MNLQIEVGLPILETHPLLKHLTVLGNNEISRLCEKALKEAGRTELESGKSYERLCCMEIMKGIRFAIVVLFRDEFVYPLRIERVILVWDYHQQASDP